MLKLTNISKTYDQQVLLDEVSLQLNKGEKLGLVGRNGHGKTTLMRMIAGVENPDKGEISLPGDYKVAYVSQQLSFSRDTIRDEVSTGLPPAEKDQLWKVEKILTGLGFSMSDMSRSPLDFSGGYQVRLNLARVLISDPDLLLLDEPNNYLDILSIRWMVRFLQSWKKELILITHDRSFMDQVVTHTAAISRKKIKKVKGNTAKMYEQLAQEEEIYEKTRVNNEKERKRMEHFITRFRAKARLAGQAQSRKKQLEKKQKMDALSVEKDLDFSFHYSDIAAKWILDIKNVSFAYPGQDDLIKTFSMEVKKDDRIAVIGKNGKGKSTLLKLLHGDLRNRAGEIQSHPKLDISYYAQTNVSSLTPHNTVEEEVSQSYPGAGITEIRSICGAMMFEGDAALKQVKVLSGGEKGRVLLAKIIARPTQLLLLDEPNNHLDMQSCDALLEALDDFPGAVIMVTHNEMILRHWAKKLIIFDNGQVSIYDGDYESFLQDIGWQEEDRTVSSDTSAPAVNPKELRRQKAERLKQMKEEIAPLESRIHKLEGEIHKLEEVLNILHKKLVEASKAGDGSLIASLSQEAKAKEAEKLAKYDRWEEMLMEWEALKEKWGQDQT